MFSQSKENKVTLAYRIIRNNISFGKWKPGDRFSSFEVAKNIGLGRTTVNDAIKKLEKNGFLRILPNVGFEVHEFTEKEMNEYLEVRLALEKIMTRYLVVSHKEETLRSIRERFRLVMASHDLGQFDITLEGLEEYHLSIATILDSVYVQNLFRETEDMEFYLMARIKEDNPKG
jgi:DNA-binding GntR family transcriptional regulator